MMDGEPESAAAGAVPWTDAGARRDGTTLAGFPVHHQRSDAVGEVHSRPSPLADTPSIVTALAFMSDGGAQAARNVLAEVCRSLGVTAPQANARFHAVRLARGELRWEQHTEFTSWYWQAPYNEAEDRPLGSSPFGTNFALPGTAIAGVRVYLLRKSEASLKRLDDFDPASLCYSEVEGGAASVATDFRQDADGFTRIIVFEDGGLSAARAGVLIQRLIEIEVYRTLAMLGLPLAQRLSPDIRSIEERLADLTGRLRSEGTNGAGELLGEITDLSAALEADAAASLYRFGASRAYYGIVNERLAALNEKPVSGYENLTAFLERRLAPAMRTCRAVEDRQANLSRKLSRTSSLIRSWVEVSLQRQNAELLKSMDTRAKTQIRLQQTVEGLSIAAVSYYIVGLIGYLVKGFAPHALGMEPEYLVAGSVPFVVAFVAWTVSRIRKRHSV